MKKYAFVIMIVLIAFGLRVAFLKEIPPGLTNDEINIAINAQSIFKTGNNIPGVVTGIIGRTLGDPSFSIHSELPSYLIIPFIAVLGFNLVAIKFLFVLASVGIIIVGYLLTKKLVNKRAAIFALVLLSINPWLIFFGRSAYESILSSFFYLLAVYLIISLAGWKKVYSILPLVAGFLCYFAAKTLLVPTAIIASFGSFLINKEKNLKPLLAINIAAIAVVIGYAVVLPKTFAGARIKELQISNISQNVIAKRTSSLNFPLSNLFENKVTEELKIRLYASLGEFSPTYLFLNGIPEQTPSLSIPEHGFLYLIDLPLAILGIYFMIKKYPRQLVLLLFLVAMTAIPNFFNLQGTTYSIRTVVLFPLLSIISAVGIYSVKKRWARALIGVLYVIFFLNFSYSYYARLPVKNSEGWFLSERILSKYVSSALTEYPEQKITIVTDNPKLLLYKYLFYSGQYVNPQEIADINAKIAARIYEFGNIKITDQCLPNPTMQNASSACPKIKGDSIKSIFDGGDRFYIHDDILCNGYQKNSYPYIRNRSDLNIEKLSIKDFCQNFISASR